MSLFKKIKVENKKTIKIKSKIYKNHTKTVLKIKYRQYNFFLDFFKNMKKNPAYTKRIYDFYGQIYKEVLFLDFFL